MARNGIFGRQFQQQAADPLTAKMQEIQQYLAAAPGAKDKDQLAELLKQYLAGGEGQNKLVGSTGNDKIAAPAAGGGPRAADPLGDPSQNISLASQNADQARIAAMQQSEARRRAMAAEAAAAAASAQQTQQTPPPPPVIEPPKQEPPVPPVQVPDQVEVKRHPIYGVREDARMPDGTPWDPSKESINPIEVLRRQTLDRNYEVYDNGQLADSGTRPGPLAAQKAEIDALVARTNQQAERAKAEAPAEKKGHSWKTVLAHSLFPETMAALRERDKFEMAKEAARLAREERAAFQRDALGGGDAPAMTTRGPSQGSALFGANAPKIDPKAAAAAQAAPAPTAAPTAAARKTWDQMTPDELMKDRSFLRHYYSSTNGEMARQYLKDRMDAREQEKMVVVGNRLRNPYSGEGTGVDVDLPKGMKPIYGPRGEVVDYELPKQGAAAAEEESYLKQRGQKRADTELGVITVDGPNGQKITGTPADIRRQGIIVGEDSATVNARNSANSADREVINTLTTTQTRLGGLIENLEKGKVRLGPVENVVSEGKNFLGMSDENSRAYADLKAGIKETVNNIVNQAKGTQTEGDVQRAAQAVLDNINDPDVALQALRRLYNLNDMTIKQRQEAMASRQPAGQPAAARQPAPTGRRYTAAELEAEARRRGLK